MTDEQISKLSAAIMRRVEYDGSVHASSLEDEIGKWVREVMEPKPIPVKKYPKFKPGDVHDNHLLTVKANGVYEWIPVPASALASNAGQLLVSTGDGKGPTWSSASAITPYIAGRATTITTTRTDAVAPGPHKRERDGHGEYIPIDQATFRVLADKGWFPPATSKYDKVGLRWDGIDGMIYKVIE